MPALSPPRSPLPSRGSGFTHGCPELLRVARAGSHRSRLARPSPEPSRGEGGRSGWGSGLARPHSRELSSSFPAAPSPRSPSSNPSPLQPWFSLLSVLGTVLRGRFSVLNLGAVRSLA